MRLDLKIAILQSGKTQRQISLESGIPETRLSAIVRGRNTATDDETNNLARVLELHPAAMTAMLN